MLFSYLKFQSIFLIKSFRNLHKTVLNLFNIHLKINILLKYRVVTKNIGKNVSYRVKPTPKIRKVLSHPVRY